MFAMAAFKVNFQILQGSTFNELVTYQTGATAAAAVPVNLTGCTARMQARPTVESTTVLLSLNTENGGITLGGAAGTIRLQLSATATALITWKQAVYDLELVFADGTVQRKLAGSISVSPEVTRAA